MSTLNPKKAPKTKVVAAKVAKDAAKRSKVGAGSIGRSSDGVTAKPKRPHRIADEKAPAVAAESPVEDASGRVSVGLDLSASDKRTLQAAGLGGAIKGESVPAMRASRLIAAELFRAANPAKKRLAIKEGAPPPLQGKPGDLLPLSAEWGDILKRLLNERDFDPRPIIDKPLRHDLIGILAHMPFELRDQATTLFYKGFRVFAKVPCRSTSLDSVYHSVDKVKEGAVRPISCPEPAGEGCEFALAWAVGDFWEYEFDILDEIDEMIGSRLNSELYQLQGFIGKASRRLADRHALQAPNDRSDESLTALGTLMADMVGKGDAEFLALAQAFRAGATYSLRVQHSQTLRLYSEWLLPSLDGWPSIIAHALLRHGLKTDRKTLLRVLGCLNTDKFQKTSKASMIFSWRFAPPVDGVNFDRYFAEALKAAREYGNSRQGKPGVRPDNIVVDPVLTKRRRNSAHKQRAAKTKADQQDLSDRKKVERAQMAAAIKPALELNERNDLAQATREQNENAAKALNEIKKGQLRHS